MSWIVVKELKDGEHSIQKVCQTEEEAKKYCKYIPKVLRLDADYSYRKLNKGDLK